MIDELVLLSVWSPSFIVLRDEQCSYEEAREIISYLKEGEKAAIWLYDTEGRVARSERYP